MRFKHTMSQNRAEENSTSLPFPACVAWSADTGSMTPTDPGNTSHMLCWNDRPRHLGSINYESCTWLDRRAQGGVYIANFTHMWKIPLNYGAKNGKTQRNHEPIPSTDRNRIKWTGNNSGNNTKPPHRIPQREGKRTKQFKTPTHLQKGHENPPAPNAMGQKRHGLISTMMPKYPTSHKTTHGQIKHGVKCHTCNKIFNTYKGRGRRRKQPQTCQNPTKTSRIILPLPECYTPRNI